MGPQPVGTVIDLFDECESADEAVQIERRAGKLGFDPRANRYDQAVAMTLDYVQGRVVTLEPNDDDAPLVNLLTVDRVGGSSGTYEQTTGPLGSSPTTGVGPVQDQTDRSLFTDDLALQHASLLVRQGTVDEPRYTITINLYANPGLATAWVACDIGSRIQVTRPLAIHTGPAPLDLIIEGYQEILDAVQWTVVIYAEPYLQYEAYQAETGTANRSRVPAGPSTLDSAYSATATSLSVTSTVVAWIDKASFSTMFAPTNPLLVEIAGEVMEVTDLVGTGLTQTFTVVRGYHGVAKALPISSTVQIWRASSTAQ